MGPIERLAWIQATNATPGLTEGALRVAVALAWRAREGVCHPSVGRLEQDTGLAERAVRRGIKALEAAGLIAVDRQVEGDRRDRATNRYKLILTGDGVHDETPRDDSRGAPWDRHGVHHGTPKHRNRTWEETTSAESGIPADLHLYQADPTLVGRWPELVPGWMQAFRQINVLDEIRKAHSWELSNPARRKRDRPRFLNGWLTRAAKDASPAVATAGSTAEHVRDF